MMNKTNCTVKNPFFTMYFVVVKLDPPLTSIFVLEVSTDSRVDDRVFVLYPDRLVRGTCSLMRRNKNLTKRN